MQKSSRRQTSPKQKPTLHSNEEDELVASLREFVALERELESSKVALTLKSDMNLHDAFSIFDVNKDGVLSTSELRDGLAAIGVFPTSEEVDLFFIRYDSDRNMKLAFNEFQEAFLAQDAYYSHMLHKRGANHRSPLYRRDDCFYADTAVEFRSMWRVHFKVEVQSEQVRQRLHRNPHFNIYEAFNCLDLNNDGEVSATEIKKLIQSRGFYVSEKEAAQVVRKFDTDHDGSIGFQEVSLPFTQ